MCTQFALCNGGGKILLSCGVAVLDHAMQPNHWAANQPPLLLCVHVHPVFHFMEEESLQNTHPYTHASIYTRQQCACKKARKRRGEAMATLPMVKRVVTLFFPPTFTLPSVPSKLLFFSYALSGVWTGRRSFHGPQFDLTG